MSTHSRFSPSAASRWLACPGSVRLGEIASRFLPTGTLETAARGTYCHEVAAGNRHSWEVVGEVKTIDGHEIEFTEEMARWVDLYLDYLPAGARKEVAVSYGPVSGTLDADFDHDNGLLEVADLKTGFVLVDPVRNPQMMLYALGASKDRHYNTSIRLTIVQPPAPHPQGPVRSWETSVSVLRNWFQEVVEPAIALADSESPPLNASQDTCKYCPAKGICPAYAQFVGKALADVAAMDDSGDLGEKLALAKIARQKYDELADKAFTILLEGGEVKGWKLVAGRGSRNWKEGAETVIAAQFKEQAYEPAKLKSPAQMEKVPGAKKFVQGYIEKTEGNPILVEADDPKAAYVRPSAVDVFATIVT